MWLSGLLSTAAIFGKKEVLEITRGKTMKKQGHALFLGLVAVTQTICGNPLNWTLT